MNRHQECLSASRQIVTVSLFILCGLVAWGMVSEKDATDDLNLRAAMHEQELQAAQVDNWPKLVAKGCAMVACDRIRAK